MVGLVPTGDPLINRINTIITGFGYTTQTFASRNDFDAYIRNTNYPSQTQVCFGIEVTSSTSGGNYAYSLRFNMTRNDDSTDGPWTEMELT